MKQLVQSFNLKQIVALTFLCLVQVLVWAQEDGGNSGTSTTTTKTSVKITEDTTWYTAPWVWVVGAAVFILLLVALTRGGGSRSRASDRVTVTKEVRRDTDV